MPLRLSLVTLGVDDLMAATAFYEQLGLSKSSESTDGVTFFDVGGVGLALYGRDALARDAGVEAARERAHDHSQSLAWNLGSPGDVDKAVVRMVAAGGRLVKAAEKTFWGGYAGYVSDLDGHLWELAHNPFWPVDDTGRTRLPD